jgi:hypothetical protein
MAQNSVSVSDFLAAVHFFISALAFYPLKASATLILMLASYSAMIWTLS